MQKNYVDLLKKAVLRSYEVDAGSLVLNFGSMKLIVHNKWDIKARDGSTADLSMLDDTKVVDVLTSDTALRIEFSMVVVNVDLSASAWSGPEAAVLYAEGQPVVAWT